MSGDPGNSADELLRRYVEAGDRQDYSEVESLLASDVVTHSPGGVEAVGVASQVAAWTAAHQGLHALTHEIHDVLGVGAVAAARIRVSGTHAGHFLGVAPTGARVDVDHGLFIRVEAGRIVEMWEVVDTGLALRQLGVLGDQPLSPGA